ncbi:ras-associating and dilute domain-containing protein isoform X1 [Alosa pseudoharengus]|uniref:ras-associating and dilute domain-containing protein isoform X1 n=1 Tax=Alosa pseudoharengus TaxID=34774 RepID=UPI003F8AA76B
MTSEERVLGTSKATVVSPVSLRKLSFGKLGRKQSNGSVHRASSCSSNSGSRPEAESTGHHRQPAKSRIRQHRHRLSAVFSRSVSTLGRGDGMASATAVTGEENLVADDPAELSNHVTAPGILKIFGNEICEGANYKSVLATTHSSARELVKEALERYCLSKTDADSYVLCDVIGCIGDHQWRTECLRVVGDNEKPLLLQSLWKPREGYARRFEIQKRASVEERTSKEKDTVTAGLNAQARKLQKTRSRGKSIFLDMMRHRSQTDSGQSLWRSRSEADIVAEEPESPDGSPDSPSSPCEFEVDPGESSPSASRGAGAGAGAEEAYKAAHCPGHEREETESSDDNGTQYFIHPPFDFPYFLLLQGYSARQDFIIYPINGESTVFGHSANAAVGEKESPAVDVSLWAPDIAPQHCGIHRLQPDSSPPGKENGKGPCTTSVKPFQGAVVKRNGVSVTQEASLRNGDLLGLGEYYLFMFKDPTTAEGLLPYSELISAQMPESPLAEPLCTTCVSSRTIPSRRPREKADGLLPCLKGFEGQELSLVYDSDCEESVLREVFSAVPGRDGEPKLTPALLLCLCLQRSATHFSTASLRKLLLRIASEVQTTVWQCAKELAAVQPEMASANSQDPEELQPLTIDKLVPGLQPLVLWMANSIELLHFIQQEVPLLLHGLISDEEEDYREEDEEEEHIALLEMRLSAVRPASEEAMTVLEEVIMFTFQQCVYYLTKVLYPLLSSVLDSHPFSESGQLLVPEDLSSLLTILQRALQLVKDFQVHWEIGSQLLAYLFFFINALLFNLLMERGSGGTFYHWSRGVQIRANLDLVMDWAHGVELGELALGCLSKLSTAVNLLATPKEHLLQDTWSSLRNEFAQLNPAQLHHLLREYSPGRAGPIAWTPCTAEAQAAFRTVDILESLDNHPPLVLPCSGFVLELRSPVRDAELTEQAKRLQEVINRLPPGGVEMNPGTTQDSVVPMEAKVTKMESLPMAQLEVGQVERVAPHQDGGDSSPGPLRSAERGSCKAPLNQKLMIPEVQNAEPQNLSRRRHRSSRGLALDPGPCSLTPPTTPQSLRLSETEAKADHHEENDLQHRNASHNHSSAGTHLKDTVFPSAETVKMVAEEEDEDEDEDEVFAVELRRGVCGLGLALVNGTETPLEVDGIYIRSILPGSPAAQSQSLCPGDRILAVNGVNLVGMDYHGGRDLIRQSGEKARLLVARSTWNGRSRVPNDCIS